MFTSCIYLGVSEPISGLHLGSVQTKQTRPPLGAAEVDLAEVPRLLVVQAEDYPFSALSSTVYMCQ